MLIVALLLGRPVSSSAVSTPSTAYFPTMLVTLGFRHECPRCYRVVVLGITKFLFTAWVVFVVDRWGPQATAADRQNVIMVVTLLGAGWVILNVHNKGAPRRADP